MARASPKRCSAPWTVVCNTPAGSAREPGGTTHADSLSGNLCVDGTIASYLTSSKLPPRKRNAKWDKTCKPLPRAVPGAAAKVRAPSRVRPLPATRLGLPAVEVR